MFDILEQDIYPASFYVEWGMMPMENHFSYKQNMIIYCILYIYTL